MAGRRQAEVQRWITNDLPSELTKGRAQAYDEYLRRLANIRKAFNDEKEYDDGE